MDNVWGCVICLFLCISVRLEGDESAQRAKHLSHILQLLSRLVNRMVGNYVSWSFSDRIRELEGKYI